MSDGQCVAVEAPATLQYATPQGGGAGADSKKPSIAVPATFMGLGGFLVVAGAVTFATEDYDCSFGLCYWDTGHYVGVSLITFGLISLAIASPFLARQVKARRRWKESVGGLGRNLAIAPVVAPVRNGQYGLALHGTF